MFLRALFLLVVVAGTSVALSWAFGAEVLAALGMLLQQAKIVFARAFAVSSHTIILWLKAQGVNFARVELGKRWLMKVLVPLLIGASNQRRISQIVEALKAGISARYGAMMSWYEGLPRDVRIVAVLIVIFATLALAVTSMSLWLLLFSVHLPLWIAAAAMTFGNMMWRSVQKMAFRTIAFMKLQSLWRLLRGRLPQAWLRAKRRWDYRLARIVVRRRKLTVSQLRASKDTLSMRWALLRERLRHTRPRQRPCGCPAGTRCHCGAPAE